MKLKSTLTLVLAVVVAFGAIGCTKKMDRVSALPGYAVGKTIQDAGPDTSRSGLAGMPVNPPDTGNTGPIAAPGPVMTDREGNIPLSGKRSIEGRPQDREKYRAQTVHFDFDRSTVKASEAQKVQDVANRFKNEDQATDLLIEGHCDERGTEGYNQSLGERRALAVREMLVSLGVPADRIHTVSLGKDRPIDSGHSEAAWKQNRRGEFILVLPK